MIEIATIGFTKKNAEDFFGRLKKAGVRKVIDIRLQNSSQLAGFAKAEDLKFFLKELGGIDYVHDTALAPDEALFKDYKRAKKPIPWADFRKRFLNLMEEREIAERYTPADFDKACLLCSEVDAKDCHRSLVVEYLRGEWDERIEAVDL